MKLATAALAVVMAAGVAGVAQAQPQATGPIPVIPGLTNLGQQKPEASLPFTMTQVTTLSSPWRLAFLPDGRMLITEKTGSMQLVTQDGQKTPVANVPKSVFKGQGGMLGVYLSPNYAKDHFVYLTYSEPQAVGGSSLALARAKLTLGAGSASLDDLKVIWRDGEGGEGGQFGAAVAFAPDGKSLFLTSGDRQRFTPAQDPNQPLGKVLHLTLDGKLWELEHGPRGGDELNLIEKGKNYGWPLVGEASNYDGVPVPTPDTRPDLQAPVLYWTPVIAPGNLIFYKGKAFPQWNGSALISGMGTKSLSRIVIKGATATSAERWDVGHRIRDVEVGPDGTLWMLEDPPQGPNAQPTALFHVTPK